MLMHLVALTHCQTWIRIRTWIPNPMDTLYYARHVHIAQTRSPTPHFCFGQESSPYPYPYQSAAMYLSHYIFRRPSTIHCHCGTFWGEKANDCNRVTNTQQIRDKNTHSFQSCKTRLAALFLSGIPPFLNLPNRLASSAKNSWTSEKADTL